MRRSSMRLAAAAFALLSAGASLASAQQRTHVIEITGFKFVPELQRARVGDTVMFVNKDVVPHTATQRPAGGWDSGTLAKDHSWSLRIEAAGSFGYFCRFHPNMTGTLIVE